MKGQNTSCAQALEARGDNAATWVASKLGLPLPSGESISPRKGFEGQQPDMLSAKATPLPDKDIPDRGTQRIVPVIDGAEGFLYDLITISELSGAHCFPPVLEHPIEVAAPLQQSLQIARPLGT
eukprot:scaffold90734_cov17-Tisochrysis_lutea.AAC.1